MVAPKDEFMALSSGIGLAGFAVSNFADYVRDAFETFSEEIFESIVKPSKITAVHYYLGYIQDVSREIDDLVNNTDEMDWVFEFIERTLDHVNMKPNLPRPDFDSCGEDYHHDCGCFDIIQQWIDFVYENSAEIDDLVVRSAFHVLFQDRKFLHDFNMELADFVEDYIEELKKAHPKYLTEKNRIRRHRFPKWLTDAVFYRDKGTCSNCRCDLSNLIRTQNTVHIDHIVPLQLFGSNDATNFQLLCETCNTSKGARSTTTSSINVPWWNI